MQTIFFNKIGEPAEVLKVGDLEQPEPGPNEIRVKILASPINPADYLFIKGQYRAKPSLPQVAGLEGAGIVHKVGENVSIPINSLVSFRHKGAWAAYAIVPVEKIIQLPYSFPIEKASQFSLNPLTAYGLLETSGAQVNDWIVVTAATSAVSKMIIQMAKVKKIKTIAVIRNNEQNEELRRIGATEILKSEDKDLTQQILQITANIGVRCILDSVGGFLLTTLITTMAANGLVIIYGLLSRENVAFHNSTIIFKNIHIRGFGIDQWLANHTIKEKDDIIRWLINLLSNPQFEMPVIAKYPFYKFHDALNTAEKKKKGKVLMIP